MTKPKSRAEQIASSATEKLIALGQLPRPVPKANPDKESPHGTLGKLSPKSFRQQAENSLLPVSH